MEPKMCPVCGGKIKNTEDTVEYSFVGGYFTLTEYECTDCGATFYI